MGRFLLRPLVAAAIVAVILGQQWLSADDGGTRKRALPPKWDHRVIDSFFSDAKSTLEGTRPDFGLGGKGSAVAGPSSNPGGATTPNSGAPSDTADAGGAMSWSKLVTSDVLQDEIKSYQAAVQTDVKNPSEFKGNLFKHARDDFSMLALAFAVIVEYDGDVRWKAQALAARDLFGRASMNCKVATDQSFNEARTQAENLAALIRGDSIQAPAGADAKAAWAKVVANRPPLMHRLDAANNKISAATANPADFAKNLEAIDHEAQIMAIIAEAIQRDGYEFTDDNSYKGFAREMEKQALAVSAAAKSKNADQARLAAGAINKACSNCHGGFRS